MNTTEKDPVRLSQERREFEYSRQGPQTLIATFDVGLGQVICPWLGDSRTEVDFVAPIAQTVATDPDADWTFVLDQLNLHQSEGLVSWVAQHGQLTDALGQKGKTGILATLASRAACLADPTHRIRFIDSPYAKPSSAGPFSLRAKGSKSSKCIEVPRPEGEGFRVRVLVRKVSYLPTPTPFLAQSNRIRVQYSHAPTVATGQFCFHRGLKPTHS